MRARSVLSLGSATAAALSLYVLSTSPAHALDGSLETSFIKLMMSSCIKNMKANQGKDPIPDAKINGYCSCLATSTAKELDDSEVQSSNSSGGKATVHMQAMNARINRDCTKRYLQKQ